LAAADRSLVSTFSGACGAAVDEADEGARDDAHPDRSTPAARRPRTRRDQRGLKRSSIEGKISGEPKLSVSK
jgi:hypothetical protein